MKLLVDEPESRALTTYVQAEIGDAQGEMAAGWLLHAELHGAAWRHPGAIQAEAVGQLLDTVTLVDLTRGDMIAAGTHAPLKSNDAIHLAVAIRLGADEMVTYDRELAKAAKDAGLAVCAPVP